MFYVLSDLHGRYDFYVKILKKVKFGKMDTLYVFGDLVDRGFEGLKNHRQQTKIQKETGGRK